MDTLKKQLERIQQQLAGLSASQKMLTASLLAIMVMTFLWWGRYAANTEMEDVFNQSLTGEDMQNIKRVLTTEGIRFEPAGDRIRVPSDKKDYAVAALAYAQVVPKNSSGSFDDFMGKISPFTPPQMGDKMINEFGQNRLAAIISLLPEVADANVIIDPSHERVVGGNVEPSASVSVRMKNGAAGDKHLAQAIATFVSGSNAQLRRSRVSVLIEGHPYTIRDADPNLPDGDADELLMRNETHYQEQVKEALSVYGNVVAVVHAKIDLVQSKQTETVVSTVISKPKSSETDSSKTTSAEPASGEPGAQSNTGASVPQPGAATAATGAATETEHNKDEFENFPNRKTVDSSKSPGEAKAISASISVPRNYFVQKLKEIDPSTKQPNPKDVEALFVKERDDIVGMVRNAIGIEDPKAVALVLGPDLPMLMATEATAAAGTSGGAGLGFSLTSHIREIAVGLLALLSLFMVSMMVKKSVPAPVIAAAVEIPEPPTLGGNFQIAGEVAEGGQTLDGMELDEDAVKAQQMVEQVSTMVKENPDAAANLVKRWLNRS
jgi:flagellar M-ring protein FliF